MAELRSPIRSARLFLVAGAAAALAATAALASETIGYEYDARGRLLSVSRTSTVNEGFAASYAYDAADNRTLKSVARIVPNPSFELPEVSSGYSYNPNPAPAGVTFNSHSGVTGNNSAFGFAAAPDGDQVAFLQSVPGATGAISLAATGLTPGASYRIRFRLARRPGYGINPITVAAGATGLGTFTPSSTSYDSLQSAVFQAAAANVTISFTGTAATVDSASALDLVAVGPP